MPKISVLMPVYNTEKYVEDSINSILNQTFKDFEMVIIDDCSSDNSFTILSDLASKDSRIRLYKNETNLKVSKTRNKLIELAKGGFIAWQDADDISIPDRLELQYNFLVKNNNVGLVGGWLEFFDENGVQSVRSYGEKDKDLRKNIFKFSPVAQPVAMLRKKAILEVGCFDEKLDTAEDLDLHFRIGSVYSFANIPKVLLKYRYGTTSLTMRTLKKMEIETIKMRFKYAKLDNYKMKFLDVVYNVLQFLSVYLISGTLKVKIFNLIRNKR